MPPAARLGDPTNHPGVLVGPGAINVLIGGMPSIGMGDMHVCAFPPPAVRPPTPVVLGSFRVLIGGKPAARLGDMVGCSAQIIMGCFTVEIGS